MLARMCGWHFPEARNHNAQPVQPPQTVTYTLQAMFTIHGMGYMGHDSSLMVVRRWNCVRIQAVTWREASSLAFALKLVDKETPVSYYYYYQ